MEPSLVSKSFISLRKTPVEKKPYLDCIEKKPYLQAICSA
jgi:hypothetical protein